MGSRATWRRLLRIFKFVQLLLIVEFIEQLVLLQFVLVEFVVQQFQREQFVGIVQRTIVPARSGTDDDRRYPAAMPRAIRGHDPVSDAASHVCVRPVGFNRRWGRLRSANLLRDQLVVEPEHVGP